MSAVVFPGHPLARTDAELKADLEGYGEDIKKSRAQSGHIPCSSFESPQPRPVSPMHNTGPDGEFEREGPVKIMSLVFCVEEIVGGWKIIMNPDSGQVEGEAYCEKKAQIPQRVKELTAKLLEKA